jgi:hypothetical protein
MRLSTQKQPYAYANRVVLQKDTDIMRQTTYDKDKQRQLFELLICASRVSVQVSAD